MQEDATAANIKLRRLNEKYKEFSKAAGLPEQRDRIKVLYSANNELISTGKDDKIVTGAISGALNPLGDAADAHAKRYYSSVRKMKDDAKRIAQNTGYSEQKIQEIKNFLFLDKHDLGDGKIARFDPSYEIAQSWQRLIDGKDIKEHDLILLLHEITEKELMEKGYSQDEAHRIASELYDYRKGCVEYYGEIEGYS